MNSNPSDPNPSDPNPSDPKQVDPKQVDPKQVDPLAGADTRHSLNVSNDTNNPLSAITEEVVDPIEAELVAYLDNELPAANVGDLESRLANDAELRQRLHELQATWDMLDELPVSRPNPAFLKSTMELVVTNTGKRKQKWHRWPLRIAAGLIVFGVATAAAMNYTRSVQSAPYTELVSNLDFYENSRLYELADVAFLELMHAEKVFGELDIPLDSDPIREAPNASPVEIPQTDSARFEWNEARFEDLSEWKVAELNGRMQALNKDSPESQEKLKKLREIHAALLKHENGKELMETLQEFSRLYYGFSSTEKTRFLPRTPEQKIRFIRDYRVSSAQAELNSNVQLTQSDVAVLRDWNKEFIAKNKDALLEIIMERIKQRRTSRSSDIKDRIDKLLSRGFGLSMIRGDEDQAKIVAMIENDSIKKIHSSVSKEVAKALDNLESLERKQKAVFNWASAAESSRIRIRVPFEELQEHYHSAMTEAEKQVVDRLLPQERKRALMNSYLHGMSPLQRNRARGGRRGSMML